MEDIKLNIRAICAMRKITLSEFAKECGITENHMKDLAKGKVRMLAEDFVKIHEFTGIPYENIATQQ